LPSTCLAVLAKWRCGELQDQLAAEALAECLPGRRFRVVCLVDEQMRAQRGHPILDIGLAQPHQMAGSHDHVAAEEDAVHLLDRLRLGSERAHDRAQRLLGQHGVAGHFQQAKRLELVRDLRAQGVGRDDDQDSFTAGRRQNGQHRLRLARAGGHYDRGTLAAR
jgi:hypothetical protein